MDPTAELRERDALLDRIRAYADRVGVIAMTLEGAAASAGITPSRLAEFFDTKDDLVVALVARNRIKLRTKYADVLSTAASTDEARRAMWRFYVETKNDSCLFFEAYGLALQDDAHYREFLLGVNDWLDVMKNTLIQSGVPSGRAEAYATLTLAVFRGLMMDLCATDERPRVNAAMELWFKAADWLSEP